MSHQTGHNRIQIHHNHGTLVNGAEQHVIDLRVIMGNAQGQFSVHHHISQLTCFILNTQQEIQFILNLCHTANRILLNCIHQLLIAGAGIMEVWNGLIELIDIKVSQLHLEFTKCCASIVDNLRVSHSAISLGGNEIGHSPEVLTIQHIGLSISRMMEVKCNLTGFLCPDMLRDLINILHQLDGLAESIGIDILDQERFLHSVRQNKLYFISLIDIADADGLISDICTLNAEESAHLLQLVM